MKSKIIRHNEGETIEIRDAAGELQYQVNVPLSNGWLEIISEHGDITVQEDTSNSVKIGTADSVADD